MRLASSKCAWLIGMGVLFGVLLADPLCSVAQAPGALGPNSQGAALQANAQTLSAEEIVTRMLAHNAERTAMLQRYHTQRTYRLSYAGTGGAHAAEIVVDAVYTAPGRKHFKLISQAGSKVLSERVLWKLVEGEEETSQKRDWQRAMFSPETYKLHLAGRDTLDGINCWVLEVEPKAGEKDAGSLAYKGKIWISMEDYATVRVLGEPVKNPSFMMSKGEFDSRYMRRDGVWVPESNVSKTHVLIGGDATMTIDYGSYPELQVGAPVGQASAETSRPGNGKALHAASFAGHN